MVNLLLKWFISPIGASKPFLGLDTLQTKGKVDSIKSLHFQIAISVALLELQSNLNKHLSHRNLVQ